MRLRDTQRQLSTGAPRIAFQFRHGPQDRLGLTQLPVGFAEARTPWGVVIQYEAALVHERQELTFQLPVKPNSQCQNPATTQQYPSAPFEGATHYPSVKSGQAFEPTCCIPSPSGKFCWIKVFPAVPGVNPPYPPLKKGGRGDLPHAGMTAAFNIIGVRNSRFHPPSRQGRD